MDIVLVVYLKYAEERRSHEHKDLSNSSANQTPSQKQTRIQYP